MFLFSFRISFSLTGVSIVSALTHGTAIVLAGGLGQSCRPNRDFSQVLRSVIDDSSTWGGAYLLGQALHGNASYPLTFGNVLERCGQNYSLHESLELENVFDFEEKIFILPADQVSNENAAFWG